MAAGQDDGPGAGLDGTW